MIVRNGLFLIGGVAEVFGERDSVFGGGEGSGPHLLVPNSGMLTPHREMSVRLSPEEKLPAKAFPPPSEAAKHTPVRVKHVARPSCIILALPHFVLKPKIKSRSHHLKSAWSRSECGHPHYETGC